MKLVKAKSTRFSEVVEKAGRPETYTLWQKPKADRTLQSLIKKHRIMTVLKTGSGSDFGMAEFEEREGAIHLAFPKSLKPFANHRIVGIKWELVE